MEELLGEILKQFIIHNAHMSTLNDNFAKHNITLIEIRDLIDRCCHCDHIDMCDITEQVLTRSGLM
jgi:hypothetical protein